MLTIFVRTIIIYVLLSLAMRVMGKRQLGELEVGELIVTLLVSELAAIPISDANIPLLSALIPILFLTSAEILLAVAKGRFPTLKRAMEGEPVFLIRKGELIREAMQKNRVTVTELLSEMRNQGIADIGRVYYATLEGNGKFSFVEKKDKDKLSHPLIIDGRTDRRLCRLLGYSDEELIQKLNEQGLTEKEILLLTVNERGELYIIRKEESK